MKHPFDQPPETHVHQDPGRNRIRSEEGSGEREKPAERKYMGKKNPGEMAHKAVFQRKFSRQCLFQIRVFEIIGGGVSDKTVFQSGSFQMRIVSDKNRVKQRCCQPSKETQFLNPVSINRKTLPQIAASGVLKQEARKFSYGEKTWWMLIVKAD